MYVCHNLHVYGGIFKCDPKTPQECEQCLPPNVGPPWLRNLTAQASFNIKKYKKERRGELKRLIETHLTAIFQHGKQVSPILLISLNHGYLY